jgi:very-short-patch-repair endonuclease
VSELQRVCDRGAKNGALKGSGAVVFLKLVGMTRRTTVSTPDLVPSGNCASLTGQETGDLTRRVQVLGSVAEIVVSGKRDDRLAAIAAAQRGRVARRQLLAAGISSDVIDGLLRRGRIFPLHPGVYAVGHLAPVALGRETAALLAIREGAVLGDRSAAMLWGIGPSGLDDGLVHVLVLGTAAGRPEGVRVHRTRALDARDIRIRNGLPVTSPARTLLAIAGRLTERQLELALDQAIVARVVRVSDVAELLTRTAGIPGRPRLAALVARQASTMLTRSEGEERMLALIRSAQLPQPEVNVRVHGYEVDFFWRAERFVLEFDGFRFHSTRRAFEHDRRKDAALRAAGVATVRVTWDQLQHEPHAVLARLAQALVRQTLQAFQADADTDAD